MTDVKELIAFFARRMDQSSALGLAVRYGFSLSQTLAAVEAARRGPTQYNACWSQYASYAAPQAREFADKMAAVQRQQQSTAAARQAALDSVLDSVLGNIQRRRNEW